MEIAKPSLAWIRFVIVGVAFVGVFVAGVYAGNVQPFNRIFTTSSSTTGSSSNVASQSESVSILENATISVPANNNPVQLGSVSTAGNRTITVFIWIPRTTCGQFNLNALWKPDKSFPASAFSTAFGNILVNANPNNAVATNGPVEGSELIFYLSSISNTNSCSISGLWLTVYLQT